MDAADAAGGGPRKRTGRRTGPTVSHRRILDIACDHFSRFGYEATTMRGIAQEAGVDTALIHHFFLTKEGLFEAAIRDPLSPPELVSQVMAGGRSGVGERTVRVFLNFWDEPDNQARLVALLRSITALDSAAAAVRGFLGDQVLYPLTEMLGRPDPRLRAALAGSQLLGLATLRYIYGQEPVASLPSADVAASTGKLFQVYLMGTL